MNDPRRIEAALARNLKEWRTKRGWSQTELASRAALSKGMLVQLELAQTNPSIATLCKLANALGVALPSLVEVDEAPVARRITAAEVAWLWQGRRKGSAAGLVTGMETSGPVELWDWTIAAGDSYEAVTHPAGARELLYVLAGTTQVDVDGVRVAASVGECIAFQADRPHRYAAAGRRSTRFLMVVSEPVGAPTAAAASRRRPSARRV